MNSAPTSGLVAVPRSPCQTAGSPNRCWEARAGAQRLRWRKARAGQQGRCPRRPFPRQAAWAAGQLLVPLLAVAAGPTPHPQTPAGSAGWLGCPLPSLCGVRCRPCSAAVGRGAWRGWSCGRREGHVVGLEQGTLYRPTQRFTAEGNTQGGQQPEMQHDGPQERQRAPPSLTAHCRRQCRQQADRRACA